MASIPPNGGPPPPGHDGLPSPLPGAGQPGPGGGSPYGQGSGGGPPFPQRPPQPSQPKGEGDGGDSGPPKWWPVVFVIAALFLGLQVFGQRASAGKELSYTEFYQLVETDKVAEITLRGRQVNGDLVDAPSDSPSGSAHFTTTLPAQEDAALMPLLREHGVKVRAVSDEQSPLVSLIAALLPWVLIIGFWLWISRRAAKSMGGGLFGGGLSDALKNKAKRFNEETQVRVRFDDVAGLREAKRDLEEIVDFLKHPERFEAIGAHIPRGILLAGPPGTGKTLLARAVAGEAGVPFFSINGSEFIELFVGVGASRVRELFQTAKKASPAIVFIDELDAVGRSRGTGLGGGHDEREQTLNQMLSEMDGFDRSARVIVMAATNRPDVLDAALLRPGRFDRRVMVDRPERNARKAILQVHTRNKPLAEDVDLEAVASATPGSSGADLENLVNEAALHARRRGATAIWMEDIWKALDKIVLGDPREMPLTPAEQKRVAIHEAGHAVVAALSAETPPVQRVSIIPRGMALGVTQQVPSEDKRLATKSDLVGRLRVFLGGYAAEQLVLGEVSSGAQDDLRRATETAYHMVAHFGMSEAVGPVFYEHGSEHPFLGQKLAVESGIAQDTLRVLDLEARKLVESALEQATELLQRRREILDALVRSLLEKETVERDEIEQLVTEFAESDAAPVTH